MRFFSTLGIEFTYLYDKENCPIDIPKLKIGEYLARSTAEGEDIRAAQFLSKRIRKELEGTQWVFPTPTHQDDGAIEIPSPVFTTSRGLRTFYTHLEKIVYKYKLLSHRDDTISGGGHIHIGLPPKNTKGFRTKREETMKSKNLFHFLFSLFRDITNRPYLNWIFNDPCDNINANSILTNRHVVSDLITLEELTSNEESYERLWSSILKEHKTTKYYTHKNTHTLTQTILDKFEALDRDAPVYLSPTRNRPKIKKPTLEFRFFDSTRNWGEVLDHVQFINSYVSHIYKQSKKRIKIPVKITSVESVVTYPKRKAIKEFNLLLENLELSPKRYEKYLVNLHDRYEYHRNWGNMLK